MDPQCANRLGPSFSSDPLQSLWHRLYLVVVFFNAGEMSVRVVSARSRVYSGKGSLLDLAGSCLGGLCP